MVYKSCVPLISKYWSISAIELWPVPWRLGWWKNPSSKQKEIRASTTSHPPNPLKYSVGTFFRQFYKLQLRPGDELDILEARMLRSFRKSMDSYFPEGIKSFNGGQRAHSMREWITTSFLDAATLALYGEKLFELDSNFKEHFLAFDENNWMFLYHFPKFLSAPMDVPKRKVLHTFTAYYNFPLGERSEMAPFLQSIEAEQRKVSLNHSDIASIAFMIYWAWVFSSYNLYLDD